MGPRSRERGENILSTLRSTCSVALQWGRAHVSAESVPRLTGMERRELASMGPRSRERGERRQNKTPRMWPIRFNGAALT